MATTATTAGSNPTANVSSLRSSPIHNVNPLFDSPVVIDLDSIEIDATNPGGSTKSLRYQRRAPSIRDSYDILNKIVYPVVVCEHPQHRGKYMHIDGFGRLSEAKARGQRQVSAIVYPSLTLEQRICLRQTLNAAQEAFDAVSIIRDLQELANQRGLDVTNPEHVKTLVRDLPEKVRKHEKDLIMLSRLHPTAIEAMGESYKKDGQTIGLDKFRGMSRILATMEERHPKTLEKLGGQRELSLKLSKMYLDKKFSDGTRSQEAIRQVAHSLKELPEEDRTVSEFFQKEKTYSDLPLLTGRRQAASAAASLSETCQALIAILLDLDPKVLTMRDRRTLERTDAVLHEVLGPRA
jgi:hypothetical protein